MDLSLNEQQEMLKKTARDFLAQECPTNLVRELEESEKGYSPDIWKKMAEMGWLGLIYPEKFGGLGGSFEDLTVLLEEIGRAVCPSPYQTCVIQSGLALLELGSESQKQQFLPKIASGELVFCFCLTEPSASYEASGVAARAILKGDAYTLNGTKLFIQYAKSADYFLVVARTKESASPKDGLSLFIVDATSPGVGITPLRTIADDKQCEIVFNKVAVPKTNLVGSIDAAWPAIEKVIGLSTIAQCAEMIGGIQAALELAVDYSKVRVQFGRPIGSFQAIQHYAANMLTDSDAAKLSVYEAAWRVSKGLPYEMEASVAKAVCSEAYQRVTAKGHQILGGIGFYKEMDMQLWYRRAKSMEQLFGDADYHREKVAQMLKL